MFGQMFTLSLYILENERRNKDLSRHYGELLPGEKIGSGVCFISQVDYSTHLSISGTRVLVKITAIISRL